MYRRCAALVGTEVERRSIRTALHAARNHVRCEPTNGIWCEGLVGRHDRALSTAVRVSTERSIRVGSVSVVLSRRLATSAADVSEIKSIPLVRLVVSAKNVRQDVAEHDDTSVSDLAADIEAHGLLHPLTVRAQGDGYEIIAGQRRYLALKQLGRTTAPCQVVDMTDLAAEEVSLTENTQRAQLTTTDKVRTYSRLYEIYGRDLARLSKAVSVTPATLMKYIKIAGLPDEVLARLDAKGDGRLTIDTAVALSKAPAAQVIAVAEAVSALSTNAQRASAVDCVVSEITMRALDGKDVSSDDMVRIVDRFLIKELEDRDHFAPAYPWVPGYDGTPVIIPPALYKTILDIISGHDAADE
jgi:ParB/RepB/Spo0J family partition protein